MLLSFLPWLALASTPPPEASDKPHFLTPAAMIKRMEASPVRYDIKDLATLKDVPKDGIADRLWPARSKPLDTPTVVTTKDGPRVAPHPLDAASMALVEQAEGPFQAKRFPEAESLYRKALEVSARNYLAWSNLGDCALNQGKADVALEDYEKALALNRFDYRLWFYKGDALARVGRRKDALDAYAMSLVLKPRNPLLLGKLKASGLPIRGDIVQPHAFVRKEGDGVSIYVEHTGVRWMAFAVCKGLWLGEPSRRQEAVEASVTWSSFEETECLASLAAAYESDRMKKDFVPDPNLERLTHVALEDHNLDELATYELGSRLDPHLTLLLTDEQRDRLKKYVLRNVMGVKR